MNEPVPRFVQIDEDGYFKMEDGLRVADAEAGRAWLADVRMDERHRPITRMPDEDIIIEAFDEPYIALDISRDGTTWFATMPYGHREAFALSSLTADEWDRFHGRTERGVPFVLSRSAQARFFDGVDEFEDDAFTVDGQRFEMRPWLAENRDASQSSFWSGLYRHDQAGWDLGEPARALVHWMPKLKLTRMRVLVAGCGAGHDAAWFAQQGHIVTAIDFSEEAIARAKAKYGHIPELKFVQANIFDLPAEMTGAFDLVFEHTLYCAIDPQKRANLVKIWRRLLSDHGHLMGVFFAMDKPNGPPFGGSEWELRSRLGKGFLPLYWVRFRDSLPRRLGVELFVYAQKRSVF